MHITRRFSALSTLALVACSANAQQPKPAPLAVQATTVRRATIATYETLDGQVTPYLQSNVATQQSGTLVKIFANEGDRVTAGQTLAKIDDSPLQAQLVEQQGSSGTARSRLAESQIQQPITNTQYAAALTQAQQSVEQATNQQTADRAAVVQAKATYDADRQLVAQGFVAQTTFEQVRAAYIAAQATLGSDATRITQARAALAQANRNLLNSSLQRQVVNENRGSVQQAAGAVQLTQTQIAQTTLTAPFAGVVSARMLDPGAYAGPNQAIYQISQIDPTYVDFNLKDTDFAYVHEGTVVSFGTSAHPGRRYSGKVATINAVPASGTLLYRARLIVRNPDYSLRGGMLVSVRVLKEERRAALVVPREALTQSGGKGEIFGLANIAGTPARLEARRIPVSVGLQTDSAVEIRSPHVYDGMKIIATRPDQLDDKTPIAIAR